ncbi:MAG: tRNA (adenosine(37)-N6)-threonylcarbamoyltransferase complex dimerization subunit type 1 TsaB [Candidatus Marinimicrobia bacterium]|nr:tRNA (adenosine(37)-N6)-threonylcarbamoyltransferase complex dimerization subunit type 1 TsaB [Candidatus Neomarinimicrobiota bacterium]
MNADQEMPGDGLKWLALEASAREASLAILAGGQVLQAEQWTLGARTGADFFPRLDALLAAAGCSFAEIGALAVGRGPGRYAGLRLALTLAQSLALPDDRPVHAVDSALALARQVAAEQQVDRVLVAGDARRDSLWLQLFDLGAQPDPAPVAWTPCPVAELPAWVAAADCCVSPDWTRLQAAGLTIPAARWLPGDASPHAAWIGKLAWERQRVGRPPEPLNAIYIHPAVASQGTDTHSQPTT